MKPKPTMTLAVCKHHFLLEDADGPTSVGICKKCGERREFSNSPMDAWDRAMMRRRGVKDIRISERPPGR